MSSPNDYNQKVIAEFREHGGKVGGDFANAPLLLLNTVGAKSGQPRTSPLVYSRDGDRYVIIASKAGAPSNPDWYYNVIANPVVTLEIGTERFQARASEVKDAERDRIYAQISAQMPGFAEYQRGTTRVIPVIVLDRLP